MIDDKDEIIIEGMIKSEVDRSLNGRITQTMIPSGTIKTRHVGEGVRFIRAGIASERPTTGELAGALYFQTDDFKLYVYTGSTWKSITLS